MQPHLVRWDRSYREQGLAIVYVADGARISPERLLQGMQAEGARFPLVHDPSSSTTRAYGVRAFPTAYVLDRSGTVVWEGIPHFDPQVPERAIQAALAAR